MTLVMDHREKNTKIINHLKELGIELEVKELPVGDFAWNGWCIERKQIRDFAGSSNSGHLYNQLEDMIKGLSEGGERAFLFMHDTTRYLDKKWCSKTKFFSMIGEVLVDYPKVNFLWVSDEMEFANVLASMYYKTYIAEKETFLWSKRTKDPKMDILHATKIFDSTQCKTLLSHYSLEQIFTLDEKLIKALPGLGATSAKKFVKLRQEKKHEPS